MKKYLDYKKTKVPWIGKIPIDWNLIRGKYLFNKIKEINKDLKCKNLLSLTYNGVLNKDFYANEGLRPDNYNTYQLFQKDDLVFKMIDLENVKTSRVGIVHEYGIMSSAYIRFQPIKDKIHPKFAYWFFYDLYKKEIYNSIGSGVRSTLSSDDMSEFEIPLPKIEEQKLISRYLDKKIEQIDRLVDNTQKKIKLLKEQRTLLISQCVTKGIEPNVEMKDCNVEWIGGIPKHWEKSRVKYKCILKTGNSLNENQKEIYSSEDPLKIPYISSKNIDLEKQLINYDSGIRLPANEQGFVIAPMGSFLIVVEGGSTGNKIGYLDRDVYFVNKLCSIFNLDQTKFVYYYFQSNIIKSFFKRSIVGLIGGVSVSDIGNFFLPLPPLEEQKKISFYLDEKIYNSDILILKNEKRIELLKEYRQSLISSAVTGKIRITKDII